MGGVSPREEEEAGQRAVSESWEVSLARQRAQRSGVSWEVGSAEGAQGWAVGSRGLTLAISEGSVFSGLLGLYTCRSLFLRRPTFLYLLD